MNLINKIINTLKERKNRKENIMFMKKYPDSIPNLIVGAVMYWDECGNERIMEEATGLFRAYKNTFKTHGNALLPHEYVKVQSRIITIENILGEKGIEIK